MKYVRRIAQADQQQRKNAVMSILNELGVEYSIQRMTVGENEVENIIVSFNPSPYRLVVGAHWDSVDGSTGANDDASGCSVMLHLIESLRNTRRSIECVFFDREEYIDHGSEGYIAAVGAENISAMVNLDVCGCGGNIAVSDKGNLGSRLFYNLLDSNVMRRYGVTALPYLPNGDDDRFADAGIPNISICTLGDYDLEYFKYIGGLFVSGRQLSREDQNEFIKLDVMSTMHNAPNDNINSVSQASIDRVAGWLTSGLCR